MLVIIDPTMPQDMRSSLIDNFHLAHSKSFRHTDSEAEGFQNLFCSTHYSHYNRYSVQV